jgi:hypothetical protein
MYDMVRSGRQMKPEMINNIIKLEEIKAHDKFFLEMGFEDEDLELNIKRLNLKEDPDILELYATWTKKSADWLKAKADETKAHAEKMREFKAAQELKKAEE